MKILLVITNINGFHEIPFSFGLNSIASCAKSIGHEVRIHAVRGEDEYPAFESLLRSYAPRVVGFTAVSSQFGAVKNLAATSKRLLPDTIVVCGGIHVTLFPEAVLESEDIDAIFVGEAEYAFNEFLTAVDQGVDYQGVPNLAWNRDGELAKNDMKPLIQELEVLPAPVTDTLFAEYVRENGWAPFFFSRGCPFVCTYCCNDAYAKLYGMSRNRPRYRAPAACIEDIQQAMEKYDFETIWIVDNIFGVDPKWRREFCERYRREIGKPFFCNLQVNIINEEYVRTIKEAGCFRVAMSIESGNEYIRNVIMKRNMHEEKILGAYGLCKKYGLETQSINIIGLPHETEAMIWDTVRLNRKVNPTLSGVNIFYPYKGTYLGDYCFANQMVDEDRYNEFSMERRDSVLRFSEPFKQRLRYFHENWDRLVYPHDMKRRVVRHLNRYPAVLDGLRHIRRMAKQRLAQVR